jgi:hypothetical protein
MEHPAVSDMRFFFAQAMAKSLSVPGLWNKQISCLVTLQAWNCALIRQH